MSTRISERYQSLTTISTLQLSSAKVADLQNRLSSGRRLTKPSDSPADTASALRLRADAARQTQYDSNSSDAQGWLSQVDSTLTAVNNQLQTARTATLRGLNDGAIDQDTRNTLADQVDSIRTGIMKLANTTYMGRPIFGGTTAGSTAYDTSGNYVGNSGTISRAVADGTVESISSTGPQVFGSAGNSLFDVLSSISADIRSGSSNLSGDLGALDTAMRTVTSAQGAAGNTSARITQIQTAAATTTVSRTQALSDLQDVDTAEMAIQVTAANTAYQAALQTTASIHQNSLLDFLR
jgi:flagellar hook-associated protein 3 FlgL